MTRSVPFDFAGPVPVGSTVTATATVKDKDAMAGTVALECRCVDSAGNVILVATATVAAPKEKARAPLPELGLAPVSWRGEDLGSRYLK